MLIMVSLGLLWDGERVVGLRPPTNTPSSFELSNGLITVSHRSGQNLFFGRGSNMFEVGIDFINAGSYPDVVSVGVNNFYTTSIGCYYQATNARFANIQLVVRRGDPFVTVLDVSAGDNIEYIDEDDIAAIASSDRYYSEVVSNNTYVVGGSHPDIRNIGGKPSMDSSGSSASYFAYLRGSALSADSLHRTWLAALDQRVRMIAT